MKIHLFTENWKGNTVNGRVRYGHFNQICFWENLYITPTTTGHFRGKLYFQSPDKLSLGVDMSDAILGQDLVHAIEKSPQQATHYTHQDKKGQVHYCPQVAVFITIWTLKISTVLGVLELGQSDTSLKLYLHALRQRWRIIKKDFHLKMACVLE